MAVLGKIRSQGLFLIIIIALALFAFIIGDLIRQGSFSSGNENVIGYVGDTELSRQEFSNSVEATMNQRQGISTVQAANIVWNQKVRDAVLAEQIDAAGIEVTDEQVRNYLKAAYSRAPQFQDENGQFSETKFAQFVNQVSQSNPAGWQQDLDNAASQVRQAQFFALLKSGVIGTNADGALAYRMENDKRDFQFVNIPYSSIPDSTVEVTKSEIKSYIKDHESQFKAEAERDITYVLFEDKASNEDVAALNDEMVALLNGKQNQYNEQTKETEDAPGLKTTDNSKAFVNANSDLPYNDRYVLVSNLNAAQARLAQTETGEVYGPYKDGEYSKITKVLEKRTISDSVKNRHILVPYSGATRAGSDMNRTKNEAKKLADSILGTIGQSKDKYDTRFAYYEENVDDILAQDIGWTVYSGNAANFAPGYTKFLYANNEGTVGVTESDFGYHVIRIDETSAPVEALKLATVAKKSIPSKATNKQNYTNTQKFQQAAEDGDFDELAKEYNVTPRPVLNLKELDENLPGIGRNRAIVQWAFKDGREVGDVERFETTQGYVVAKVNKISKAGVMTPEEASAKVTPILRNKKKADIIINKIKATDLNSVATNNNVTVQTANGISRQSPVIAGVGQEPRVVGTAFGLKEGATSKAIAGEKGVFMIKVTGVENAPELENYTNDARIVAQRTANQSTSALVEALKKATDIEDKRAVFY
ncbi:peptidylprolyl isomerase [Nonlabens ponticola]|uniref:Periplasmic chaperone PpiD n=1 Tax=Nonlabens ponticola TaxID=2496866 RepID=A0A3S9MWP4_9FLAO|nr:peptidylprolyl isomerase [Nonlabens ponticola]AZQ43618.1 peptidylprolyl isomerase [Nonlabens ponticola]